MIPLSIINLAASIFEVGQVFLISFAILCGTWLLACVAATATYMGTTFLWKINRNFTNQWSV